MDKQKERRLKEVRKLRDDASRLMEKGKHAKALDKYLRLEEVDPEEAGWSKRVADCYRRLGRREDELERRPLVKVVRGLLQEDGRVGLTQGAPPYEDELLVRGRRLELGAEVPPQEREHLAACLSPGDRNLAVRHVDLWQAEDRRGLDPVERLVLVVPGTPDVADAGIAREEVLNGARPGGFRGEHDDASGLLGRQLDLRVGDEHTRRRAEARPAGDQRASFSGLPSTARRR